MIVVFCFKASIFKIILWPCESDFWAFETLRNCVHALGINANIYPENIELITTDISSQFMAHLSVSFYVGIMLASPYVLFEIIKYISPALYETEKKYTYRVFVSVYLLFVVGMLVSYWILFPISCRFFATYSVSQNVKSLISLDSYMSLFISLTILMGLVFQMPILAIAMAKMGIINHSIMATYRRHAFILIVVIAAIITPPDILTLIIVSLPLYLLYEASIVAVRIICRKSSAEKE